MDFHQNARLTVHGRERIVRQVMSGQTPKAVALAAAANHPQIGRTLPRRRRGAVRELSGHLGPASPALRGGDITLSATTLYDPWRPQGPITAALCWPLVITIGAAGKQPGRDAWRRGMRFWKTRGKRRRHLRYPRRSRRLPHFDAFASAAFSAARAPARMLDMA
jgi:hypothetical protein